jgi:hypothetical protein
VQKTDLEKLIAAWGTANRVISPASGFLTLESVSPALAQLSFLSGRQEYWDVAICAVGFADERYLSASDVLVKAAEDLKAHTTGGQTRDFLNYCNLMSSVPEDTLSVAASIIVGGIGNLNVGPQLLLDFETCYELCGDNETCLSTCLADKVNVYA